MRETAKALGYWLATIAVLPTLISFAVRRLLIGADRALGRIHADAVVVDAVGRASARNVDAGSQEHIPLEVDATGWTPTSMWGRAATWGACV